MAVLALVTATAPLPGPAGKGASGKQHGAWGALSSSSPAPAGGGGGGGVGRGWDERDVRRHCRRLREVGACEALAWGLKVRSEPSFCLNPHLYGPR